MGVVLDTCPFYHLSDTQRRSKRMSLLPWMPRYFVGVTLPLFWLLILSTRFRFNSLFFNNFCRIFTIIALLKYYYPFTIHSSRCQVQGYGWNSRIIQLPSITTYRMTGWKIKETVGERISIFSAELAEFLREANQILTTGNQSPGTGTYVGCNIFYFGQTH